MKHCAKKLLGLAFALALCLAVGGTALAQTPVLAEAPDTLPEQEMLAYEPYAAPAAEGMNTVTGDGYTVTIPTTVEVNSGTNEGKLEVNAQLKQYRTLNITIEPQDKKWTLKYQGDAAGTTTPEVGYELSTTDSEIGTAIAHYDPYSKILYYQTAALQTNDPQYDSTANARNFTTNFSVNVPTPSQATMSGTYSDTLAFTFDLQKQCVTYTINVYGQNITTKADGRAGVESVVASGTTTNGSTRTEGTVDDSKVRENTYTQTYTLEYGFANGGLDAGNPSTTWTRTRPTDDNGEDARCWEDLASLEMTPSTDYAAGIRNVTINLNLVRKWYWLDVNGATDYTGGSGQESNGNQGGRISGYVDIKVSADDGATWSDWFWYKDGDDYWEQLPYGVHFKLGLHHVKNGYVYDMGTDGGVKIIANKQETKTAPGDKEGATTYYVHEGTLTGEWTDTVEGNKNRYCYIPCYKKGITYFANGGTGGTESVNTGNPPRTNVLYEKTDTLKDPEQLGIIPPTGMIFAGWSTSADYPTTGKLYQPGNDVGSVEWEKYTDTSKRPKLDGKTDDEKRELYAIWTYPCKVKVQFGRDVGWTTWDEAKQTFPENKQGGDSFGTAVELGTVYTYRNAPLTVSATENTEVWEALQKAINAETSKIASAAQPEKVWQLKTEYTFNSTSSEFIIQIKRKRYLLNVIPALLHSDGSTITPAGDKSQAAQYGSFRLSSCGAEQTKNGKVSYYQWMRNYGGLYQIWDVEPKAGYQFAFFRVIESNAPVNKEGTSYSSNLTGKNSQISYFGGNGTTYEGDTIYVVFKQATATPGSTTPMPGPSLAPARKALTLRYHANFDPNEELALDLDPDPLLDDMDDTFGFAPDPLPEDVDDALEGAVKTVSYQPGEDVVLRNCMFKRSGYVFVGWNTEPDGTGRLYRVNGVPITDWAAGDTVDLYAQWKKPDHLKPVVDNEPFVPTDPDTPPEELDPGFGIDPDADPADEEGPADDADAVDDAPAVADEEAAAAPPEELDFGFGIDPDAAVGGPAPFVRW